MKDPSWENRRGKPKELYDEAYAAIDNILQKYKKTYLSWYRIVGIIAEAFKDARSK